MKKILLATATIGLISSFAGGAMAGHHDKMMDKIDTDGNGLISKSEFIAKHEEKFIKMDKDGDGNLSKEEMRDAREKRKEKMKEKASERGDSRKERRQETE